MKGIFDIHSHILPRLDDGSKSSEESVEMLRTLGEQGVSDVVMTPHFYATQDEPVRFFERRNVSASHLFNALRERAGNFDAENSSIPNIYLGAEVAFFNGMNRVESLREMCISGTDRLLVEMPFDTWTMSVISELREFKLRLGVTPIIAHINRHFGCFNDNMLDALTEVGVEMQINAEAFLGTLSRHRAFALLKEGYVHYIGSDCHNMGKRAPNIAQAVDIIRKKQGEDAVKRLITHGEELAAIAKPSFTLGG